MSSAKSEDGEDNDFMGKLALSEITYTFKRINTHGKDIFYRCCTHGSTSNMKFLIKYEIIFWFEILLHFMKISLDTN